MGRRLLAPALLLALVAGVFGRSAAFDFVNLDDTTYVARNGRVITGVTLENVAWAWTVPYAANWHPLTWMSLMVDAELFGEWAGGYHVTNVVLHALSACVLFSLLSRTTGAWGLSLFVAAIFAIHPLHVESVAWVSERKDTLSTLLALLAMDAYVRSIRSEEHRRFWYVLSLVWFTGSLLSKQMYVTLPALLCVLDVWPLGRLSGRPDSAVADPPTRWQLLREKAPYAALSVLFAGIAFVVQGKFGAISAGEYFPLRVRAMNAVNNFADYLWMAFWPRNLSAYYPYPSEAEIAGRLPFSIAILVVITGLCVWFARRRPALLAGWLWYLGTLFPVSGIVQLHFHRMCDRFTYFPLIGASLTVAWGAAALWTRFTRAGEEAESQEAERTSPWARRGLRTLAAVVVLVFSVIAWRQTGYWRNSITLYEHAIAVDPQNYLAHSFLGVAWHERGEYEKAERHFRESIRWEPPYDRTRVRSFYASMLIDQGRYEEELRLREEAVELDPRSPDLRLFLAQGYASRGRREEAIRQLQIALKQAPDHAASLHQLAELNTAAGEYGAAELQFQRALELDPWNAQILNNAGNLLRLKNDLKGAIRFYRRAVFIEPMLIVAQNNLASALAAAGEVEAGIAQYRTSLRYDPENAVTRARLARLLFAARRRDAAIQELREALRIDPDEPEAVQFKQQLGLD